MNKHLAILHLSFTSFYYRIFQFPMSHQHNIFVHSKSFYYQLCNIVPIISSFLNLILRVIAECRSTLHQRNSNAESLCKNCNPRSYMLHLLTLSILTDIQSLRALGIWTLLFCSSICFDISFSSLKSLTSLNIFRISFSPESGLIGYRYQHLVPILQFLIDSPFDPSKHQVWSYHQHYLSHVSHCL
jgi:hypothetical protein